MIDWSKVAVVDLGFRICRSPGECECDWHE